MPDEPQFDGEAIGAASDPSDDAWYFHDERDHAWHTHRRYDECADCRTATQYRDLIEDAGLQLIEEDENDA